MSGNVFIDPLDLSNWGTTSPGDSPGFTQLVQDVLGSGASALDGFDAALSDASALVDALDAATGEQDAALDAILVTLDTANPAPLDNSMAGYASSFDAGNQVLTAGKALHQPPLLELPISPALGGIIGAPPTQVAVDLGTHHVGDAPFMHVLGTFNATRLTFAGLRDATLAIGDPAIFQVNEIDRIATDTHTVGSYVLLVTPAIEGVWIAQVNTTSTLTGLQIITFTLTVVP